MVTPKEMGRYLTGLREDVGLKQNELADRASLNPAILSRIESGDRTVSPEELQTVLDAIGTGDALRLKQNAHREWRKLDRPVLGHANEDLLWDAEQALLDIDELRSNPEITAVFYNRLEEYEEEIRSAAAVVRGLEQTVAFVGEIGVGKTTALCRAAGLEVRGDTESVAHPVLDCGWWWSYGVRGPRRPGVRSTAWWFSHAATAILYREVREFAVYLNSLATGEALNEAEDAEDRAFHGTSWEVERAIRNMSGLIPVRRRGEDGRRQRSDPALDLARGSSLM